MLPKFWQQPLLLIFTQRVEMYFKKRPELVNHVQEAYQSYRALAERYDHLSKEMQSANRTIAAIFPEQVQYVIEDDDEFTSKSSTASTPVDREKVQNLTKENFPKKPPSTKRELPIRAGLPLNDAELPISDLTKEEAQERIIRIQKEMLALQTEREFQESICRCCNEKSGGIEQEITDMKAMVDRLQDKFGFLNVPDDNEAPSLMAATALKSCQDAFSMLQEKQGQLAEKIDAENQRVRGIINKFTSLRSEVLSAQTGMEVLTDERETDTESADQHDSALLRSDSSSSHSVTQLADRINELLETVAGLETVVSSQDAQINVLRSEADGLQKQIKTLEEGKENLKGNAEEANIKMKELEEELIRVKSLSQSVKDQNETLQTHFTEARCNIDHLSEKLQNVYPDEGIMNEEHMVAKDDDSVNVDGSVQGENDAMPICHQELQKEIEKKDFAVESINPDDDEEQQKRQEDNEKHLSEELGLVVRNYREVKQRLNDVEKKNRDGFFELVLQIRELKNELAVKDKEIESLKNSSYTETNKDQSHETNSTEWNQGGASPESLIHTASTHDSDQWTTSNSPLLQIFDHTQSIEISDDFAVTLSSKEKEESNEIIRNTVSTIEDKFRTEIDEFLEGNLELWMRFSNSFNQIDKYRNSVKDLKAELTKLKAATVEEDEGNYNKHQSTTSEGRAIYKHLSQIKTELTLWLENNLVLKDEIKSRKSYLFRIHEEIIKLSKANSNHEEPGLHKYQAAKFLGEILNMKQESDKVTDELQAGRNQIILVKEEVEKTLTKMDEELRIGAWKQGARPSRVPLRSFLFGVKLKKQKSNKSSILSRIQAGFQDVHNVSGTKGSK